MKLFAKLLITALVLAVLLPFTVLKDKDGKPLMTLDKIKAPNFSVTELPESIKEADIAPVPGSQNIIYKWYDSRGEIHFTSSPPAQGISYTAKGYDPDTNLIQSVEVPDEVPEQVEEEVSQLKKPSEIGNPYSAGKIEKLIEDAQNVQKLLNDRIKNQEAIVGQ